MSWMMRCSHGHLFDSDTAKKRRYIGGESEWFCPECDDDDLTDVDQCVECGEWFDNLNGYDDKLYCTECLKKLSTVDAAYGVGDENPMLINGFYEQLFTREEIEHILREEAEKLFTASKMKHEAREYCMSDQDWFADFLSRREAKKRVSA